MTGLTRILQQSLRVRYELDLSEVIQAYVQPRTYGPGIDVSNL